MTPQSCIEPLVRRVVDGTATEADRAEIRRLVLESDEALKFYLDYLRIHAVLLTSSGNVAVVAPVSICHDATKQDTDPASRGSVPLNMSIARFRTVVAALVLASAVIASCFLVIRSEPVGDQPQRDGAPIATLIEVTGQLTTPGGLVNAGGSYPPGDYALDTGTAEFMLTNSVNVKLHGKTQLRIHDDMNVSLNQGSVRFVCPTVAKGFTVNLPDGTRVVDLGTVFRVDVDDAGAQRVYVLDGSVTIEAARAEQPLTSGRGAWVIDGRIVPLLPADLKPEQLLARPNLLRNGGFEDGNDSAASEWIQLRRGVKRVSDSPRTGRFAARLTIPPNEIGQSVRQQIGGLQPGDVVTVCGFARIDPSAPLTGDQRSVAWFRFKRDAGESVNVMSRLLNADSEHDAYRFFSHSAIVPPKTTSTLLAINLENRTAGPDQVPTIYLDDLHVSVEAAESVQRRMRGGDSATRADAPQELNTQQK